MQDASPAEAKEADRVGPTGYLSIILLWALVAITFYQFFTRYVLNSSAAWTEELAQYGLMLIVFIGSIIVSRKNGHIRVVILQAVLPVKTRRLLILLSGLVEAALIVALFVLSLQLLPRMHDERMVFAAIPLSVVYAGIALSLAAHVVSNLQRLLRESRAR